MAHLQGFTGVLQVDGYGGCRVLAEKTGVKLAFCWAHLWMPPLLQGSSEQRRYDKRLQSSIRPSYGEHPASPAVMVRSADRAKSREFASKWRTHRRSGGEQRDHGIAGIDLRRGPGLSSTKMSGSAGHMGNID
jgi:hypothetical protein